MGTDALGLGRLERIADVRGVWKHEATVFTPWLADNIDLLSDAIDLPLTVVEQEVQVGEFRLDIHATDPDGRAVVIENQLAPSDHSHLGQLLVYASGLAASTAVWITTRMREDHRSALTWMNERTDSDVRVFGIELGVVRIGTSQLAPVFDVVVEPNEWAKVTKQSAKVASTVNQARAAFFDDVFARLSTEYPVIRTPKTQVSNWCSFASGPFGYYSLSFSKQGYRIEVYLDTGEKASTKRLFDGLLGQREHLERELGFELDWERLDNNRGSRVATYLPGFVLEGADGDTRQKAVEWSASRAATLHRGLDGAMRDLATAVKSR